MAVLIKGMEMPQTCSKCPLAHESRYEDVIICGDHKIDYETAHKVRVKRICPLIEIPETKSDTKLLEEAGFELSWKSSDETIVIVSAQGIATALSSGEAVVTATDENGTEIEIIIRVGDIELGVIELDGMDEEMPDLDDEYEIKIQE